MDNRDRHDAADHDRLRADVDRWNALPLIGIQRCEGASLGVNEDIELRDCTCGSTLGRRIRRPT